jgi:hypothetical protein
MWPCPSVPRAVDLVSSADVKEGEEVTLDYGARPLRDMLRGYGFIPYDAAHAAPYEVCNFSTTL